MTFYKAKKLLGIKSQDWKRFKSLDKKKQRMILRLLAINLKTVYIKERNY